MAKSVGRNDPCPCGSGKKFKKCCNDIASKVKIPTEKTPNLSKMFPGIPPYCITKMIEDPHVLRRVPLTVRNHLKNHCWTPSKVARLSTDEIVERLTVFDIVITQEKFRKLTEGRYGAWGISEKWLKFATRPMNVFEADFLGLASCELWKRWIPEKVSIETLDDWMQEGYELREKTEKDHTRRDKEREIVDIWFKVWHNIRSRLNPKMRRLDDTEEIFQGTQCLFNWVQDFEFELGNMVRTGRHKNYGKCAIEFCRQIIDQFPDEDDLLISNFWRSIGELHFHIGETEEGERILRNRIREQPKDAGNYVTLAESWLWLDQQSGSSVGKIAAIDLLEKALKHPVENARDWDLESRLHDLKEQKRKPGKLRAGTSITKAIDLEKRI